MDAGLRTFIEVDAPPKTKPQSAEKRSNGVRESPRQATASLGMISTESTIEAPSHPVGSQRGQYQETTGLASPRIAGTTGRPFHGQKLDRAAVPPESRFADVPPRPPSELWIPDLEDDALPAPEIDDTPKRIATNRGPLLAANSNATRSLPGLKKIFPEPYPQTPHVEGLLINPAQPFPLQGPTGSLESSVVTCAHAARMFHERPTGAYQMRARSLFGCGTAALGDSRPSLLDDTVLADGQPAADENFGPAGFVGDCCGDCPPGWRVRADGFILRRENSEITFSTAFSLGEFGFEEGGRVSLIRHIDCLDAWEITFIGPYHWKESGQVAGVGLTSRLSSTTLNLSEFDNATLHAQRFRSRLNSLEVNRRSFGWDVISTFAGVRYLNIGDDFLFQSTGTVGTGELAIDTDNNLFGPHIGVELMCPLGRWMTTTSLKGGLFANIINSNVSLVNNGIVQFAHVDNDIKLAANVEFGYTVSYQVTPRIKIRGGYEFWWLYGLTLAPDQLSNPLTAQSGSKMGTNGGTHYHGATAGVEVEW